MFVIFRTRRNDLLNETFGGDKCRLHWDLPEHYYEEVWNFCTILKKIMSTLTVVKTEGLKFSLVPKVLLGFMPWSNLTDNKRGDVETSLNTNLMVMYYTDRYIKEIFRELLTNVTLQRLSIHLTIPTCLWESFIHYNTVLSENGWHIWYDSFI